MALTAAWQDVPTSAVPARFHMRLAFSGVTDPVSGLQPNDIVFPGHGGLGGSHVSFHHEGNNVWRCDFDLSSIVTSQTTVTNMRLRGNSVSANGETGPPSIVVVPTFTINPALSTQPTVTFSPATAQRGGTVDLTYTFPHPASGLALADFTGNVTDGTPTSLAENSSTEYVLTVTVDADATALAVTLPANAINEGNTAITTNIPVFVPVATTLEVVSGSGQSAGAGQALTNPLVVRVLDQNGDQLQGTTVNFSVSPSDGTLSAASAVTGANGRASVNLTLGTTVGTYTVTATVGSLTQMFTATATAPPAATTLQIVSGNEQTAQADNALDDPLVVQVLDQFGNAFQGATVNFVVSPTDGTLSAVSATTGANGQASVTLRLGPTVGDYTVTASVAGITATQQFTLTATEPVQNREDITAYNFFNDRPRSLLPQNKQDYEAAVEGAFQYNIYPVENRHVFNPILHTWNPAKVRLDLIAYFGHNLGLNIDDRLTETQKRNLLMCAWNIHQYAGTPHAVLEVIRALGYPGVAINEGVQGHWANYEIVINEILTQVDGEVILRLVKDLKPTRSVLVGIDITGSNLLWDGTATFDGTHTFGYIQDSGVM